VTIAGIASAEAIEPRRRQPGMAGRGELHAIKLEEGMGHRIEAEGVALLDDDTGGLAPNFDDEGFGHGWISWSLSTWSRSGDSTMAETAEVALTRSKDPSCGANVAMNSSALTLRNIKKHCEQHDEAMTTLQLLCRAAGLSSAQEPAMGVQDRRDRRFISQ